MAKVPKAVRLTPETVAKAEAFAVERGVSLQVVYESAIVAFLEGAPVSGGLVVTPSAAERRTAEQEARATFARAMATRQQGLNAGKERASR